MIAAAQEPTNGAKMGRFSVSMTAANRQDEWRAKAGLIAESAVRRATLSGVVDTGATRMVLPEKVATELGLPETGKVKGKYADGRQAEKSVVGDVEVEIQGRRGVFSAIVEPDRADALIGAIVLEELDFLADCVHQSLVPRDPKHIIAEIE